MFKKYLILGIVAAVLSSAGAVFYGIFFNKNLFDFSIAVGPISITAACTFVSIFAAVAAWAADKALKSWSEFVFNLLFSIGTMASIMFPINFQFPKNILILIQGINFEGVESFFPIYAIPMHFFPVLVWVTLKPLFFRKRSM
jgi:hypothetical protein